MTDVTPPPTVLLFVHHTILAKRRSGVQRVVVELARALARRGAVHCVKWDAQEGQLRFLDHQDLQDLSGDAEPDLIPHSGAWALRRRFLDLLDPSRRYIFLTPEIPFHIPDGCEVMARVFAQCRSAGVPCGSIFYDLIPITNAAYAADRAQHQRYIAELLNGDWAFPISRYSAEVLADYSAGESAARIVPVPLPDAHRSAVAPAGEDGRNLILLVGTVEPRKRQLETLRVYLDRAARSPALAGLRVVVVGSLHPDVAKPFQRLVEQAAGVEYLDYCSEAELASLYDRALFSVFASEDEGFGLPISESLARGVPVICADFGSMAEVAAGGGCLTVDVRDEQALGDALERLAGDATLRRDLREQIARRPFRDWDDYVADLLGHLGSVDAPFDPSPIEVVTEDVAGADDPTFDAWMRADALVFRSAAQRDLLLVEAERRAIAVAPPPRLLVAAKAAERAAASAVVARHRQGAARRTLRAVQEGRHRRRLSALPVECRRRCLLRIVISTYNRGPFVEANVRWLLKRVIRQGGEVELVVVDNASTDDTARRLAKFIGAPGFTYLRNPANLGMLGNLGACAALPGAEYVWMIGDDDFIVPEQAVAVLDALKRHFGIPLLTVNFGVFHRDAYHDGDDPGRFVSEAHPLSPHPAASGVVPVSVAAIQHDNLFTAIYPIIWRADHAGAAFNHPFTGVPFGSLTESIPSTDYILSELGGAEIYWHAPVTIAGNLSNSWARYRPRWHGVLMPEALELARDVGVDPSVVGSWALTQRDLYVDAKRQAGEKGWSAATFSEEEQRRAHRLFGPRFEA